MAYYLGGTAVNINILGLGNELFNIYLGDIDKLHSNLHAKTVLYWIYTINESVKSNIVHFYIILGSTLRNWLI